MAAPKPSASWYNHFRKRTDLRYFYAALGVSALFHLSMVTVFTIVIHFPRHDIVFRDFTIIPVAVHEPAPPLVDTPASRAGEQAIADQLALRGTTRDDSLPDIQLPTLEFAELERLRVRQESFQALSRYDDLFQDAPDDSWARFSRSLSGLGRSLSDLRLSGSGPEAGDPLALERAETPRPTHTPAAGFEAFVVWASEPRDRQLLFAPPVDALWDVDPAELARPIEVVMQINALGRVVNVFSPNVDARELVDAVQLTALQYRFEPLDLGEGDMQTATLRIQPERAEAAP